MSEAKKACVLIVDDVHINRMLLSSMLDQNGVATDLAEGGMQCLEKVKENHYDLILMDHRMPEVDGVDTLVALKEYFAESGKEIPVICHTTRDATQNMNLYKAAGFTDLLIKPIQPMAFLDLLRKYLPEGSIKENK